MLALVMTEKDAVHNAPSPRTRASLAHDLRTLGVEAGMTLLMHSSLSKLGWVSGGSVAVVQALMDVVTPVGTIIVPTFSTDLSDPAHWNHPPVPQDWWPVIYDTMPAFDPRVTPTRMIGKIAETFRSWPDVVRSYHPVDSFAAWGKHAHDITAHHSLDYGLGEGSPLARIYDLDGWVLLLGVGHGNNTSLHLAEYRSARAAEITQGSPIFENGQRVWKSYRDIDVDDSLFPDIGTEFDQTGHTRTGQVGSATARLFRQRPAVDFAQQWMLKRKASSLDLPAY